MLRIAELDEGSEGVQTHVTGMVLPVEEDEALDPGDEGLLGTIAEMTYSGRFPHAVKEIRSPRCG